MTEFGLTKVYSALPDMEKLVWCDADVKYLFSNLNMWPSYVGTKPDEVEAGVLPVMLWPEQIRYEFLLYFCNCKRKSVLINFSLSEESSRRIFSTKTESAEEANEVEKLLRRTMFKIHLLRERKRFLYIT